MITVKNNHGYETKITAGNHSFISDEPVEAGGTDMGATPYDLLLAALGSCKAITVRMYASRKNIPLESIIINLSHKKIHAEDCKDCETKNGMIDNIDVEISFTGNQNEEQIKKLLEIADKCPVHKTLRSEVNINTKLK